MDQPAVTAVAPASSEPETTPRRRRGSWAWIASQLPVAVPPVVWAALAWHQRWITDDGLIVARTVREILAGNGPVFNPGERVEADTSVLWTWLLALVTWVTRVDVYTVMVWTGVLLAPLGLLFGMLGARQLHRRVRPDRPVLPVGAVVVLALAPFWNFATSGLEDCLVFCWLGLCWWLLAGLRPQTHRRAAWLAFVAGLGWLVRPDMVLGTAGFLAAGWYLVRPGHAGRSMRGGLRLAGIAVAVPGAYQVFRMGYYGLLVPNTAVAKDASSPHLNLGLSYLGNYAGPYWLWIPLLGLLTLVPLSVGRRRMDRGDVIRCAAMAGSGVLMAAYVVAIGGDFMHARMLLPATFTLLLPVMMLPVPRAAAPTAGRPAVAAVVCLALIGGWAVVCGTGLRTAPAPWSAARNGIDNERDYWSQRIGQQIPDTPAEYIAALMGSPDRHGSQEWLILKDARSGTPLLLYKGKHKKLYKVPLNRPQYPVAVTAAILGTWGAGVPLDGLVVDERGLSYAVSAHLTADPNGRPGHTKYIPPAWIVAEYSNVTRAPGIPTAQLAAARKALSCGTLAQLNQATQAPMSFGRFVGNFFGSVTLTTFRFSANPFLAEQQLCG